ncbi:MAG: MAPEG family protein [Xanthomonadales bacterium]|nr:MAPEG family protein [Xanthomonadales bacterium]
MIIPFYAACLALIFIALSVRTLSLRKSLGIAIGDRGDNAMLRAMRVHANFAEYTPLSLLLLFMLEQQSASPLLLHALGAALLVGRFVHAVGVSSPREDLRLRVTGMALTFTALGGAALALLYHSFTSA